MWNVSIQLLVHNWTWNMECKHKQLSYKLYIRTKSILWGIKRCQGVCTKMIIVLILMQVVKSTYNTHVPLTFENLNLKFRNMSTMSLLHHHQQLVCGCLGSCDHIIHYIIDWLMRIVFRCQCITKRIIITISLHWWCSKYCAHFNKHF